MEKTRRENTMTATANRAMLNQREAYFGLYNQVNILVVVLTSLYDAWTATSVNYLSTASHPVVLHTWYAIVLNQNLQFTPLLDTVWSKSNQLGIKSRSFLSALLSQTWSFLTEFIITFHHTFSCFTLWENFLTTVKNQIICSLFLWILPPYYCY